MPKGLFTFALVWLVLAAIGAFYVFGTDLSERPLWQWALLLAVGPPVLFLLQIAGEALGELFNRLPGVRQGNEYVERKTSGHSFSGVRVLWYLLTLLLACALVAGATWIARTYF
jgi:hypothetical protein